MSTFPLLTDGLKAEREQGITIDVAYRSFSTPRRRFIIADTPGHEQYTRNMATGASTADVAIILIDANAFAKAGSLLPQSRRHTYIASLLGIPHVVAAVNKMDLVGYSEANFEVIPEGVRGAVRAACAAGRCRDSGERAGGGQYRDAERGDVVVPGADAAGISGDSAAGTGGHDRTDAISGAAGAPSRCKLPRLCGAGGARYAAGGRPGDGAAFASRDFRCAGL